MTALGPQIPIHEAYNRLGAAHMMDTPSLLLLPDGTTMVVVIEMVHEETAGGSLVDKDRLTTRCEVKAAYDPGVNVAPILKEIQ